MTSRGRWVVRAVMIAFAVVIAFVFGVSAWQASAELAAATDPGVRRALLVVAVGAWLEAVGMVGLYVSQAVRFRDWSTFTSPFAPGLGRLGSRRQLWRARRQIDGREPYTAAEVPRLRAVARYRVRLLASSVQTSTRLGSLSLVAFFTGMLLQPPTGLVGPEVARAFQVLSVVMIIVLGASLVIVRRRTDAHAEAFLARTAEVPPEPVGP